MKKRVPMPPEIPRTDAIVVGSGPNGMAAAIELARAGLSVAVLEAKETLGGAARTAELTLPGFLHDVCSAIYPLGLGSPFLAKLPLKKHGLDWIHPPAPLAHPFDNGKAAVLHRSVAETALTLGRDGERYMKFMSPLVKRWSCLSQDILGPIHVPRHPLSLALFGLSALRSAVELGASIFRDEYARGLFAGLSAHSFLPLEQRGSAAFGMALGALGHVVGWPFPRQGAQQIINSMAAYLRSLGGLTVTKTPVTSLDDLPPAKLVLLDVTPRQLLSMAGKSLPWLYREQLKHYHYGPGVFKIDWALDGPIPWKTPECKLAGTVHLGGTMEEIAAGESEVASGKHPTRPFVLVAQQSLFDESRAPAQKHTGWAYCHVPHNSSFDMTGRIEEQIERFAPGFRHRILARHARAASEFEEYNPNCVGGDINGGLQNLRQIVMRPALKWIPYATPLRGLYICSSSTPPGGGVHGLCGYYAARAAIEARA
jgi:phytoene dehydrogenase-like protein